ncbi:MAG: CopD family protein [Flavobacteriales bacterium]
MSYDVLKALHIIFVVTWFAGLFYIARLFVYHRESAGKAELERQILHKQFSIMEKRLMNVITTPSAILTLIIGSSLLYKNPSLLQQGYMHVKLAFVFTLFAYHVYMMVLTKRFQQSGNILSSMKFRFLNEYPTIVLIAVVFIIILKSATNWIWGVSGILGIAVLLTVCIKLYQKSRKS